jgi:hypothetical protein
MYAAGLVSESHFLRANGLLWFVLLNATSLVEDGGWQWNKRPIYCFLREADVQINQ